VCKSADEPCNEGNHYGAGTTLSATPETKATFTSPINPTECTSSSLSGQLTSGGGIGSSAAYEVTSASFSGCSNGITVTVEGLPWTGTVSSGTALGEGSLNFKNVKLKFFYSSLGVSCYYGGNVSAKVQGSSKLVFSSSGMQRLSGGGILCGTLGTNAASWSGTYGITAPSPFYVSWQ
jgi:hypothetical protein